MPVVFDPLLVFLRRMHGVPFLSGGFAAPSVQQSSPLSPPLKKEKDKKEEETSLPQDQPEEEGGPRLLVTVGSTSFDGLIAAAGSASFLDTLRCIGRVSLTVQVGRGKVLPFGISPDDPELRTAAGVYVLLEGFTRVRVVRFIPSLPLLLQHFDIIISHCGAATLLEALRASRRVVACVNPSLLNNHQLQLAVQLAKSQHCVSLQSLKDLPRKTLEAWRRPLLYASPTTPSPAAPVASSSSAAAAATTANAEVAAAPTAAPATATAEAADRELYEKPLLPLPPPNSGWLAAVIEEEITEAMETEI